MHRAPYIDNLLVISTCLSCKLFKENEIWRRLPRQLQVPVIVGAWFSLLCGDFWMETFLMEVPCCIW